MEPKNRKILVVVLVCVVLLGVPTGLMLSTGEFFPKEANPYNVLMVLPISSLDDPFTIASATGGYASTLEETSPVTLGLALLGTNPGEYEELSSLLQKKKYDLVFAPGYNTREEVLATAPLFPDIYFLILDSSLESYPDNIADIQFKNEEVSLVTGYIAGMMTESKKVGFVGGMNDENIGRFLYGFKAGIEIAEKQRNISIPTLLAYTMDYSNELLGYELAEKMYKDGADIIFSPCGNSQFGCIKAAMTYDKYVIGVDKDMNVYAPNNVLFSATKDIETAVNYVISAFSNGTTFQGPISMGYMERAFGIVSISDVVPELVVETASRLEQNIIEGKIVVPKTAEEFATWNVYSTGLII
ncbi:MAG TPA: BMP family ABC transporter substrate-binding protein [Methanocorpusculum sp.]|nr:BMP family ABC transporter substrate-binding protein [Methanocorpusculum sp.]HJJ40362.1 BMP family ABC transporter substrate-binding protein [Methanocorpusculum sp.]HJJ49721.1 BMP family ABC transporter substrate-binding protein [Methanocorpusculum sp.]HJJ57553.1 BMP family ABC transporter substrate-binding protein [Methanocorpusculum sp.]